MAFRVSGLGLQLHEPYKMGPLTLYYQYSNPMVEVQGPHAHTMGRWQLATDY